MMRYLFCNPICQFIGRSSTVKKGNSISFRAKLLMTSTKLHIKIGGMEFPLIAWIAIVSHSQLYSGIIFLHRMLQIARVSATIIGKSPIMIPFLSMILPLHFYRHNWWSFFCSSYSSKHMYYIQPVLEWGSPIWCLNLVHASILLESAPLEFV